ncbi:hypothetical protein BV898_05311 [Hypsibius exemplaris]|uniref:Uncharacterized protein n=1 Tax=Hypsibius exemplaris TaxID=2072580 RepID=A0A1W0WZU6_HYPEX|nr:hypothetical protein BV898_05311 [Hypsibius exemplaris]
METKATAGLLVLSLLVTGIVAAAIKGPDGSIKEPASRSMVIKMDGAGRQSVKFNDDDEDIDQIGINNGQITEQNNWRHRDTDDIGQIGINGVTGRIKEYNYDPESVNQRRIGKTGSFIDPLMSGGRQVVNFNNDGADIDQIGINNGQITEHNWKRDFGSQGDIGQVGINGVTGRIKEYNYDPTNDIDEIGFNNGQITEHNWRHRDTDGIVQIGMNGVTGRIGEYNYDPDHDIDQIGINNGQITEHNWRHRDTDDISQIGINGVTGRIKEYNYDPETVNARLIGQIGLNTGQLTSNSILEPGQTDRQPSIGQIGLDLGKRTENKYILPGSSDELYDSVKGDLSRLDGRRLSNGINNGGTRRLGEEKGQIGILYDPLEGIPQLAGIIMDKKWTDQVGDIGVISFNNGYITEYNYHR